MTRFKLKTTIPVSVKGLSSEHLKHLRASGISTDVIRDRGYHTELSGASLTLKGFSLKQAELCPTLVMPIRSVDGRVVSYQLRPDFPRTIGERTCKYEIPSGSRNRLDVPRRAFVALQDTNVPLWITEGVKKADAAVSNGLCCIALFGVHNWVSKKDGDKESSPLDDWNKVALSHRLVYICFDSDVMTNPKVAQARQRLRNFLLSKNATVKSIYLPANEGEKVGLDDYLANGGTVDQLQQLTRRPKAISDDPGGLRSDLPTISTHNKQLAPNVDEALDAITEDNEPPELFNYSGRLTRLRIEETNRRGVPRLETMTKDMVIDYLSRVANFVSISERGQRSVNPPDVIARMILSHAEWPDIPKLNGLVTSPIFASDGTLVSTPGYHPATGMIYYEPMPLTLPDTTPSDKRIVWAVAFLHRFLVDFPLTDDSSFAHAVAFLILPFVRELIDGPTPLHLFDAPRAATGKSLLMSVLASVFMPRGVSLQSAPKDEEEWRKRLTTMFRDGSSHILFDNIRDLSSESLQAALTAPDCLWKDRLLGGNDSLLLPVRCVFAATANNITGTIEQLRRCVQIRLDAKIERPEDRTDFKHPDIRSWVRDNRHTILKAVLVIVRSWIEQGMPEYSGKNGTMGSFESWASVVGGILETVEIDGFLANRKSFTVQSDSDRDTIRGLVTDWHKVFGGKSVKAKELLDIARRYFDLGEVDTRIQSIKLGKILGTYRDNVISGCVLIIKPTDSGALYRLEPVEETRP